MLQFNLLSAAEQKMSAAVGVPESFVARKAAGQTVKKVRYAGEMALFYFSILIIIIIKLFRPSEKLKRELCEAE